MHRSIVRAAALSGAIVLSLSAAAVLWMPDGLAPPSSAEPAPAPPPAVPVAEVVVRMIAPTAEFTGFTEAVATVDVMPRAGGLLVAASVPEGRKVRKGDLLFSLDREPFLARVEAARAALDRALGLADQASADLARAEALAGTASASRKSLDDARAVRRAREADVAAARAALRQAEIDLGYTEIRAPIAGVVDRVEVQPGNLVAAAATRLTRILATDQLHVTFDIDEATYVRLAGQPTIGRPVQVAPAADPENPVRGSLDFLAAEVDRSTGTLRARATLDNADGRLKPGMFARVRIPLTTPADTVLVSEAAIGADQGGRYVLAVDADGLVTHRTVDLGEAVGGLRAVRNGLSPGDRIVVKGLVRPGMTVTPEPVPMPGRTTDQASAPATAGGAS